MKRLTMGVVLVASSLTLLLLVASANTCRFVLVAAVPGAFVEVIDTSETGEQELTETLFDAFCDGHLMNIHGDIMWLLVKIFHVIAIAMGAAAAFLSLMVHYVAQQIRPFCWQTLSVCSAFCALMSVPIFLLFETEPCKDFPEQQSCSFGLASYIHVAAIVFAIITTICTQCFDPPIKSPNQQSQIISQAEKDKQQIAGRYWLPLQSEKEVVSDDEDGVKFEDDLLEKGAVVTTSTEDDEEDEEEDRAQSDAGVIGATESQEEQARLLPLHLSYENVGGGQYDTSHDISQTETGSIEEKSVDVDLRGPAVVYESLERDVPTLEAPSLAPTDELALTDPMEAQRIDLMKLPSLIDEAGEEDESGIEMDESTEGVDESGEDVAKRGGDIDEPGDIINEKKVGVNESDDLGSLEPTVADVSGAESVLDRADYSPECRPTDSKGFNVPDTKDDAIATGFQANVQKKRTLPLDISRFIGSRRRNGYRLMDDTDIESTLPMSPPLEIITMNMINNSLEFDDFEDLYENKGLDQQLYQPKMGEQNSTEPLPDDDALDPELLWNDEDDFVGMVSSTHNRVYEVCDVDSPDEAGSPPTAKPSCSLKRRRNRRWNAGMSLASANSLLSYTIAEETASDLVDTDDDDDTMKAFDPYGAPNLDPIPLTKSRSAPNLARFEKPSKNDGWVVEDLQLTGVNTYKKKAQVFSVAESSSLVSARRSTGGMKESSTSNDLNQSFQSGSSSSLPGLLSSGGKKIATFREEKVLREGIHATQSNVSDTSSVGGGLKSLPPQRSSKSINARDARIRRLQNTTSPIKQRPEPEISSKHSGASSNPINLSRPPRPPPVVNPFSTPIAKSIPLQGSPDTIATSIESLDASYDPDVTLSMMDATLAELTRDLEMDEMSV